MGRPGSDPLEERELVYEKLPHDITERHVLLMDPVLATGRSADRAIEVRAFPPFMQQVLSCKRRSVGYRPLYLHTESFFPCIFCVSLFCKRGWMPIRYATLRTATAPRLVLAIFGRSINLSGQEQNPASQSL